MRLVSPWRDIRECPLHGCCLSKQSNSAYHNTGGGESVATKIFVDAGHGGPDPGAVGNGVTEQAVNLNVARELARLLYEGGYEVMQYRTTRDENVLSNKNADL
ncbi:MAG: N-acetylmuramoyl-L-alanine amidase, partial [Clostridia bacterium]|nr:N-acetylmuramoyl-L-alanine amidase [Clostridia bacterium]